MTNAHTRLVALLALSAALTLAPWRAEAQSCDRTKAVGNPTEALAQVRSLNSAGCLGGPACDSPLCQKVRPLLEGPSPKREQVAEALRSILQGTRTAGDLRQDGGTLLTRMGLSLAQFVDNGQAAAAAWTMEDLVLFSDEQYQVDFEARLQKCGDGPTCTAASNSAQTLIELATLFGRTLTKANQSARNAFAAQLDLLDKQWRAYLGSSRGQSPWELALNSALYRKTAGFDRPPTSQWIFAHPGAAFELTQHAPDRQPSESLLLELAGVYRWSWREEKMRQRWGGSVTLAWRDAGEGRQKLGYGVLAYLPRASTIGYVWRPQDGRDEHALVLSADLVKFLRGSDGIRERLIGGASGGNAGSGK